MKRFRMSEGNMGRGRGVAAAAVLLFACGGLAQAPAAAQHAPEGWLLAGSKPASYRTGVDAQMVHEGLPSAYLVSAVPEPDGFGTLMQYISADNYAGKRIRLRASVRSEDVSHWAGLWMRVDKGEKAVAFDNMQKRSIKGTTQWRTYDVVLDVPASASGIGFGLLLDGPGQAWMSGVQFEVVGREVPVTDMVTAERPMTPAVPVNLNFQR
jgi:hypothetical protein